MIRKGAVSALEPIVKSVSVYISVAWIWAPSRARPELFYKFNRSADSPEEMGELRIRLQAYQCFTAIGVRLTGTPKMTHCSFKRSSLKAQRRISHSGVWQGFWLTQASSPCPWSPLKPCDIFFPRSPNCKVSAFALGLVLFIGQSFRIWEMA